MEEEHSKVKDLDIIFNKIMLHLGSNSNNNNNNIKKVREKKIMDKGDLLPLKNIC